MRFIVPSISFAAVETPPSSEWMITDVAVPDLV